MLPGSMSMQMSSHSPRYHPLCYHGMSSNMVSLSLPLTTTHYCAPPPPFITTTCKRLRRQCRQFECRSLPTELLRKYVQYAKMHVFPRLTPPAAKVLQRLYLSMRSQASLGTSIPVTTRHLESLIRLSQARARAELR